MSLGFNKAGKFTDKKLWLAPLAGYTDRGFRTLCKTWGVDVLVSEMVSADGLVRDSLKTRQYILFEQVERPYGIQIFGSEPYVMAKAAEYCLTVNPDFIDLNMGCPVRKVVKRGAGSALMKKPALAAAIMREVKSAVAGSCPVGAKFRSGWDASSLNYLEFGLALQDAGADFLCLHPRTQSQQFSGLSDWQHIAELKRQLAIPLIGNGDIGSPEAALKMYRETGCNSLMIGRGALGKPWIFKQIRQLLECGDYSPITRDTLRDTILQHIEHALRYKREAVAVKELRSQLCHYTKGLVGGAELRQKINHATSAEEIRDLVRAFFA